MTIERFTVTLMLFNTLTYLHLLTLFV